MFRRIILHIEFPKKEFGRLPSVFENDFSLRYKVRENFFYLGEVDECYWHSPRRVVAVLEIRKDETPAWYLRGIVQEAQQKEIVMMEDSKTICKGGHLARIEGLDEALDEDIVIPLEAWITHEKAS